jgi:hypothetical protein
MSAVLVRVHLPRELVERIDKLAAQVCAAVGHKIGRAAVIRALIYLHIDTLTPELTNAITTDDVKRGRPSPRRPT